MNGLIIYVNWEYFLGVVGTLIAIAYYANGRFTRIETSIEWLKEALRTLKVSTENATAKLFDASSPIALTGRGRRALKDSGLAAYIDSHKDKLTRRCHVDQHADPYDVQSCSFRIFADLELDAGLERSLREFAFANGLSTDLLRRLGAIYLRDLISPSN
jgi:hypothetical protein